MKVKLKTGEHYIDRQLCPYDFSLLNKHFALKYGTFGCKYIIKKKFLTKYMLMSDKYIIDPIKMIYKVNNVLWIHISKSSHKLRSYC